MRFARTALVGCIVLLAVTAAVAQTGGIEVTVTDSEGLPLPGATVTISNKLGYIKTTTEVSDRNGIVVFPVLRPGEGYSVQISFPGFSPIRYDDQRVKLSSTQSLRVQMIEAIQEQVKVIAESDVVDLDKSESSTRFSDDFISDLPVPGRFYQNVLTMAPGVQDADGDGNPNVHGSRSRDFQAVVGNVSNVDPLTGQWLSRINANSIEEMEVITAGAGVEFGRAQGGFARIIQKQGSNTHEGIVEVYWRTSKLDGDGANNNTDLDAPDFDSWQPGFQFSGPLLKDKLWYRASYERIDDEVPINVLSSIEVFTRERETYDVQLTWQASPRNKLALQYRADPDVQRNAGLSNRVGPESSLSLDRDVETYTLNWTAPYSPKVLVESTVAWQDINRLLGPSQSGLRNDCVPNAKQPFINEAYCNDTTRNIVSGSWNRVDDDHRQRFTVKGQSTVYGGRFWGMTHQFKFGINVENERYFRALEVGTTLTYSKVTLGNNDDQSDPDAEPSLDEYGSVLARMSVPQSDDVRATGTNWALYAEDQFKPMQDMTITLGARMDREEINSGGRQPFDGSSFPSVELNAYSEHVEAGGLANDYVRFFTGYENIDAFEGQLADILCEGNEDFENCAIGVRASVTDQEESALQQKRKAESINIANTNISPFISIGWSPWANGKTAFKFTAGRYYNNLPLVIPLQELEPAQVAIEYRASLIAEENCPDPDSLPPDAPPPEVACGQVELEGSIEPRLSISTVDRGLKTPYQDEFTFKVERELWSETSVSLTYVNRQFKDQIQDININLDNGDLGACRRQTTTSDPVIVAAPGRSLGVCSQSLVACDTMSPACPGGGGDVCDYSYYTTNPADFCSITGDCLNNESPFGDSCTPGDPYCGVAYPDTEIGAGDGFIDPIVLDRYGPDVAGFDNCSGTYTSVDTSGGNDEGGCGADDPFCRDIISLRLPDEAPDLYLQNVFWGDIFLIGNFNEIDYEAFVLELVRRQYRSWEMSASYTWSEATGDGEDFFQGLGDDPTLRGNLFGAQSYDQTHVVKVNATTVTPWGIRLGGSINWQSGLPYSLLLQDVSFDTSPPVTEVFSGRARRPRQTYVNSDGTPVGATRNSERNESFWDLNLKATKEMRLGKGMNLALSAEIFNVLDDDTYQIYNPSPFFSRGVQINGTNEAFRRFGRSWQVGAKLAF
jgi:hypothetical protein